MSWFPWEGSVRTEYRHGPSRREKFFAISEDRFSMAPFLAACLSKEDSTSQSRKFVKDDELNNPIVSNCRRKRRFCLSLKTRDTL